jgi:tetratricopeptide (TPR) repeat protein
MRVISLYSFKGGVGRTSLALNLAYELASQAKFVVLADWDLHAPGLSLMEDLAMPGGPFPRKGILDFLWSALGPLENSNRASTEVIDPLLLAQTTALAERARATNRSFGDILFVPAGLFGTDNQNAYPKSLRKLYLPDLMTWRAHLPGSDNEQSVLRFFRDRISTARSEAFGKGYPPDFLLLDSRTGITEIGDLLLGNGVDHYIILFGLNEQNQTGMELVVRGAQDHVRPGGLPDALTLVASPVPVGEEDLLRERLTTLSKRLTRLARPLEESEKAEPLPPVLRIPYHPRLALQEEIILERYPDSALAQNYKEIAGHILKQERTLRSAVISTREQILADVPSALALSDSIHDIPNRQPMTVLRTRIKAPRPYVDPPPWNWADQTLTHDILLSGIPLELSQILLNGIAWSSSLRVPEKIRVMTFAMTLPGPRIARLAEPFVKERESRMQAWEYDWREVEAAHARAAADWTVVLERLRHINVDDFWRSIEIDPSKLELPESFSSPRFFYLAARRLMSQRRFQAAVPLYILALSSADVSLISEQTAILLSRLRKLNSETIDSTKFSVAFPFEEREAFQSFFDLHITDLDSMAYAMRTMRRIGWTSAAKKIGGLVSSIHPAQGGSWSTIAIEYRDLGDLGDAERAARRAIEQNPNLVQPWIVLATSLVRDKSRSCEAYEALQHAEQLATDPQGLRLVAVTLAEDFSEYQRALQLFERIVEYRATRIN